MIITRNLGSEESGKSRKETLAQTDRNYANNFFWSCTPLNSASLSTRIFSYIYKIIIVTLFQRDPGTCISAFLAPGLKILL